MKKKEIKWVDGKLRQMAWFSPKDLTLHVNENYKERLEYFVKSAEKDGFTVLFIEMCGKKIPFTYDIINQRGDTHEQIEISNN